MEDGLFSQLYCNKNTGNNRSDGPDRPNRPDKPDKPDGPDRPTKKSTVTSNNPKTGDTSNINLWIALLVFSIIGMTTIVIITRKKTLKS